MEEAISEAIFDTVSQLGYTAVKPEQLKVITGVLNCSDVFAVLPTGFGKSLCYACLPQTFDKLELLDKPSIVIVVTPLIAIMKDQVSISVQFWA